MELFDEYRVDHIISTRFVPKVGKHIVRLVQEDGTKMVWMTERQLAQMEACFLKTPKGYSTKRKYVTAFYRNGYYAFSRFTFVRFDEPPQYNLSDLEDTDGS